MTANTPGGAGNGWLERLEHVLDVMTGAYGQLDALSRRQRDLIDRGEFDRLLALLTERQSLVVALEEAAPVLDHSRKIWQERADCLSETKNAELSRRMQAIEKLALDIAERDRHSSQELDRLRDQVADELAGLERGNAAITAYGGKSKLVNPRFQDRKG